MSSAINNGRERAVITPKMLMIAIVSVFLALIGWIAGFPMASLGALAATPFAIFNHWLILHAMDKAVDISPETGVTRAVAQFELLKWSAIRVAVSIIVLLAAMRVDTVFMIGALAGLFAEMITYTGDAIRLLLRLKKT